MMIKNNLKMALDSLRSARWRTFLTMLGIIIGVVSVVTTVSLGEGVRQQITREISQRGPNLVTVLPGNQVQRDSRGNITGYNPLSAAANVFTQDDLDVVKAAEGAAEVVPFARVTGIAQSDIRSFDAQIIAISGDVPGVLNQPIQYGAFLTEDQADRQFAVIGRTVAEQLFENNAPIGNSFRIRDETFIVRGVFEPFPSNVPLLLSANYDNAIFIPYNVGKRLMGGSVQIYQILVNPESADQVPSLIESIDESLLIAHAGAKDFTVLRQAETLSLANNLLNVMTGLIAGIAAVSLLVGGIGIMNILFVSVSERTGEIGVRKAIGATNGQILSQFLIEAIVISVLGAIIGIILAILSNFAIRILTTAQPVVTLDIVIIATGVALVVGCIFGVIPAFKAARKDPIESLRSGL